ncbi:MAG TPA: sulfatase-like hydrolase/transferase, partial [Actinomycetota bacterium]
DRWLPSVLSAAGYRTIGISANPWISGEMGFDLGFEEFHPVGPAGAKPPVAEPDHHWRMRDLAPEGLRRRAGRTSGRLRDSSGGRDLGSREALEHVRALADDTGDRRPWFLFVNVMEAHAPYLPPRGFGELAPRDRFKGPALHRRYMNEEFLAAYTVGAVDDIVKEELKVLARLYRAEVEYADAFLAGTVEALHDRLDRTVVVVTADHGENLGEGHRLGHVAALDERLVRVPLAVVGREARPVYDGMSLAAVPGVIAGAVGLDGSTYPGPPAVAVAQYESAWLHLRGAPQIGSTYELTAAQEALLRSPMSLATDGRSWLVRTDAGLRAWSRDGDDVDDEPLRAALDGLPAAPVAGEVEAMTPELEAGIEAGLRELGAG